MYWLSDLTTNNTQNIQNIFPTVTLEQDNADWWFNLDDKIRLKGNSFTWIYLYPGLVSFVYIPLNPIIVITDTHQFNRQSIASKIPQNTLNWGIHIISGNGISIILDSELGKQRFREVQYQELLTYREMIRVPKRYRLPLHLFVDKAIKSF